MPFTRAAFFGSPSSGPYVTRSACAGPLPGARRSCRGDRCHVPERWFLPCTRQSAGRSCVHSAGLRVCVTPPRDGGLADEVLVPPGGVAEQRRQRGDIGGGRGEPALMVSLVHEPQVHG